MQVGSRFLKKQYCAAIVNITQTEVSRHRSYGASRFFVFPPSWRRSIALPSGGMGYTIANNVPMRCPPEAAAVGNSTGEHTTTMHQLSKAS